MKLAPFLFLAMFAIAPPARAQSAQDEVVALLLRQDYGALEESLGTTQQKFERGELGEYALQQAFEPFARLRNAEARRKLREWAEQSPRSYVANLALGLNDRASGSAARGSRYWEDTAPEKRAAMRLDFALAEPRLRSSIALTSRPYLSLLNLMIIAGNGDNRPILNAALLLANEALPSNLLARAQYARYLLPRWGGSYERFDAFVAMSREAGVAEGTLSKLQAIELNDRGLVLRADHDGAGADALFRQALQLARESGDEGGFRSTWLAASVKHVCSDAPAVPVCQPAVPGAATAVSTTNPTFSGHLGDDIEHPVVMPTEDHYEGVRTEYAWVALRYPGARRTMQAVIPLAGRHYDVLTVTTADGRDLRLYFDITAFFGGSLEPKQAGASGKT